jgi:hypothetical protein
LKEIDRIIISLELEDMKQADILQLLVYLNQCKVKIHRIKEKLTENSNAMTETNFKELWQAQNTTSNTDSKELYLKQNIYKGKQG